MSATFVTRPVDFESHVPAHRQARPLAPVLAAAVIAAFAVAIGARVSSGFGASFWLDESWTGAFASAPSLRALTQQVRDDANAPSYYFLAWTWARLFGVSDLALRAPSLLFSLLAPIVAGFGLRRACARTAWTWAALVALWIPGVALSSYARCYALLLCASTATVVVYVELMRAPTLRRAAIWAAAGAFTTLTHYHAALLVLVQGIGLLVMHRRRTLALWPATLAFVPAFAWIGWHAPRLAAFARPEVAWYDRLTVGGLPDAAGYLLGTPAAAFAAAACGLFAVILSRRAAQAEPASASFDGAVWWAAGTSVVAAAICLAIAALRPSFTLRYLTPFAPGVLLLVCAAVSRLGRARWEPLALLVASFTLITGLAWASQPRGVDRVYNFEQASNWIAATSPTRLVFFWDHPATAVEAPAQLDAVGGFFLRRAGLPVQVSPLYASPGADMTSHALAAAGDDAALLWLYDTSVHGTSASAHPPVLAALGLRRECRNFGAGDIGVLACRRPAR